MAWSEQARRAALEARRRKSVVKRRFDEQRGNFHTGGTKPREWYAHDLTPEARRGHAQNLKAIRARLRSGGTYNWVTDDDKVSAAASASSAGRYYGRPRAPKPITPTKRRYPNSESNQMLRASTTSAGDRRKASLARKAARYKRGTGVIKS